MQSQPHNVDLPTKTIVYFDGACPLCSKEIDWYKGQRGADSITWHDVSETTTEMVAEDLKTTDALGRFHVRETNGGIVSGAAAFSSLWLCLPRFRLLGKLVKLPMMSGLAEIAYRLFLRIRPLMQRWFRRA